MFKVLPLAAALVMALTGNAVAQDAEAGAVVFKKCAGCHQVGGGAQIKSGPILNDLVGRVAGTSEGFRFRKHIVAAGEQGLVWDEDNLVAYLNDPTKFLRAYLEDRKARSGMSFKLRDETDARNVIAFIQRESAAAANAPAPDDEETTASAAPVVDADAVVDAQVFEAAFLADKAQFEAGKEIWFDQCTHCHGFKAYPGKAPKLKPADYTPEFVFKRVYKGFKKMPAWNDVYTVDEIRSVVVYIKSLDFSP